MKVEFRFAARRRKAETALDLMASDPNEAMPIMSDFNHKYFYEDKHRVDGYAKRDFLSHPEKVILDRFDSMWGSTVFLDLGVGAGRTTKFFAPHVKHYIGVDFSEAMIRTCEKKFGSRHLNSRFLLTDVTDMCDLDEDFADFVMFSYNGLGDLAIQEINDAMSEVKRVLRPGGYFFFSLCNILWLPSFFRYGLRRHPLKLVKQWWFVYLFRKLNPEWRNLSCQNFAYVNCYKYDLRKPSFFVNPFWQVEDLKRRGFSEVQVFLNSDGTVLAEENKSQLEHESSVHFLCRLRDC